MDAVKVSLEGGVAGAISSADTAQATANGKNTVHYSTSTPGSTPNIVGDIWWQYSSGIIIGQWTGAGGTSWTLTTIGSAVIANLDAGKITVGILSGIEITGVTIASSAYTQGSVADGQIVLTDEGGAYGSVMKFLAPSSGIESARLIGTSGGAALVGVGSMVTGLKTLSGGVDRYLMFRSSGGNLLYVNGGLTIDQGDVTIAGGHKITASGEAHGSTLWSDAPVSTAQPTANVYMTAGGQLQIMTSTESAKTNIRPADIDIAAALALEPKVYQSLCDADDPDTDIFGFSAQQAKALGLDAWVVYEADGETVQGFSYTGWVVALQATNRHQQTQIDDLTAKVEHLTGIVEQLAANQTTSGDA